MAWTPTLLEDSVDPWLAVEPDGGRRRAVLEFLVMLCEQQGRLENAVPIPGTALPAFASGVPDAGVVIVWVIAAKYEQLAIRYLYDVARDRRFGG
jgi:hypothetical protein